MPTLLGESPEPIPLSSLPDPPPEIAKGLRDWHVQLTTGPLPASDPVNRRRLSAKTDYEIAFNYRCQPQWTHDSVRRTVRIGVKFTRIQWRPTHTIWLRSPPTASQFWSDPLVLHELDHVQISADPRIKKKFIDLLKSQTVITASVGANEVVNRSLVDRLVREHVAQLFQQMTDLIDIRYQELDRITNHGRRPIPEDSVIRDWLEHFEP